MLGAPTNITASSLPVVLAVAALDSDALVRDSAFGGTAHTAAAIALLGAIDALRQHPAAQPAQREVAFAMFEAESWGYTGSRKFVADLAQNKPALGITNLWDRIEHVVGVDQVGLLLREPNPGALYAHSSAKGSALAQSMHKTSLLLAESPVLNVQTGSNGLPPSSIHSFLRQKPSLSAVVLSEFATTYKNKFYGSQFDDGQNYDADAVVEAATRVARYLRRLSHPNITASELAVVQANASVVTGIMQFLVTKDKCEGYCSMLSELPMYGGALGPFGQYSSVGRSKATSTSYIVEYFFGVLNPIPMLQQWLALSPGVAFSGAGVWDVTEPSEPIFTESRWDLTSLELIQQDSIFTEYAVFVCGVLSIGLHGFAVHKIVTWLPAPRSAAV